MKRSKDSGGHFWFYYHDFRLSRSLEFCGVGIIIYVDLDISESQHRHQYARETVANDPAAHLRVRITGKDAQGNTFEHRFSSGGEITTMKANTLVDMLENVPIEVTEKQERRWLPTYISRDRDKALRLKGSK
jgi:hypothetical protein